MVIKKRKSNIKENRMMGVFSKASVLMKQACQKEIVENKIYTEVGLN